MTVAIPSQISEAMLAHAYSCHPEESCGLMASDAEGRLRMAYPLTNSLHSDTNYTIDPTEHFRALRHAEGCGWEITGVFHSHPHSRAFPSPTDIRLAAEPDWLYVLIGMEDYDAPVIRGFRIVGGKVIEESLEVERKELLWQRK